MSSSNRRVYQIARLSRCSSVEALGILRKSGFDVITENDLVNKDKKVLALEIVQHAVNIRKEAEINKLKKKAREEKAEKLRAKKVRRVNLIGHPGIDISYLNTNEVIDIHWLLVNDFEKSRDPIIPPGVKSRDLLASAMFRVHTSLGGEYKYSTIPTAAAAYLHALISNHAFHNGNKRTALVATLVFLDMNNYLLDVENEEELFEFIINIAAHNIVKVDKSNELADEEMNNIARWIHKNLRPISKHENILKLRELKSILREFGCKIVNTKGGSSINLSRESFQFQINYRNEGTDVSRSVVRRIRKALHLMDEDGYDSIIFYNKGKRVPEFIRKYRRTLNRLAKV